MGVGERIADRSGSQRPEAQRQRDQDPRKRKRGDDRSVGIAAEPVVPPCHQERDRSDCQHGDDCGRHRYRQRVQRCFDDRGVVDRQWPSASAGPVDQGRYRCDHTKHHGDANDQLTHDCEATEPVLGRATGTTSGIGWQASGHGILADHHDCGEHEQHQAERKGNRRAGQVVRLDRPGQRVVAHQLDGAEVTDRVQEHKQGSGGDRRRDLRQHDPPKRLAHGVAQHPSALFERRGQSTEPGCDREIHVWVREQREHQP